MTDGGDMPDMEQREQDGIGGDLTGQRAEWGKERLTPGCLQVLVASAKGRVGSRSVLAVIGQNQGLHVTSGCIFKFFYNLFLFATVRYLHHSRLAVSPHTWLASLEVPP